MSGGRGDDKAAAAEGETDQGATQVHTTAAAAALSVKASVHPSIPCPHHLLFRIKKNPLQTNKHKTRGHRNFFERI